MSDPQMRSFITGILRDMVGNVVLSLSTGRTEPTEKAPFGKLKLEHHEWFNYPAELDLMVAFAEKAYEERRDAYISPIVYGDAPFINKKNEVVRTTAHGRPIFARSKTNALWSQTIYMDSDACPPEAFRIPPSRHVDTSVGHGHDYWFLVQPVPAQVAGEIAHRITTAHKADGSDPSGWSANKVLRLPTWNTTYDELSPFEVTWGESAEAQQGEVYAASDISGAYDDVEVVEGVTSDAPLPPVPPIDGLPDFEALISRIPASERRLNDLIYKEPRTGDGGWRSEQLWALLLDSLRFGFTDLETASIAWHAPASSKYKTDARGFDGLWWEIQTRAVPTIEMERGSNIAPAPMPVALVGAPRLLRSFERTHLAERRDLHSLYQEWGRSKVPVFNAPYHHMNALILFAVALGDTAILPKDPKPLPPNIYTFFVGDSSSGKTESEAPLTDVFNALYKDGDSPFQAGRSSKEALIEELIARDGRVTYITEDEGDGLLLEIAGGGPMAGMQQIWTKIYDGDVPALGRVGRKELNQAGRKTVPTFRIMGTPEGVLAAVNKGMFYTGFLPRQVWVLGEDTPVTQDSIRTKLQVEHSYDPMPKWWASHLTNLRQKLLSKASLESPRAKMVPTVEAWERLDAAKWEITQHFQAQPDSKLWNTVSRRMGDIMWKVSMLQAMSQGRTVIGLRDVEFAIGCAEVWLGNVVEMANKISDTVFSKQCDDIERFIAMQKNQTAELGAIYRYRKAERTDITNQFLDSLVKQGRVSVNGVHYSIKGATR